MAGLARRLAAECVAVGRPLEWDARNGVVQRLGAKHGIPTSVSDVVVPLLAAASQHDTSDRSGGPR